jgi:branched-chain amino acid transport system ATP-binding protein
MAILSARELHKAFGGVVAVDNVSLDVENGEILGIVGPNGSGKTTLLNMLSGHLQPDRGRILSANVDVTGRKAFVFAQHGVMRMFQITRVFNRMSVLDNLVTCGQALGLKEPAAQAGAQELIAQLQLEHVADLNANQLSGGQRKLLEFGSCFMVTPKVALLDEPFSAVHPSMRQIMFQFIRERLAAGQTFVLVGHDMPTIVDLCPRTICMNAGKILAAGETRQVLQSHAVIEAYLGEEVAKEAGHGATAA